MNMLRSIAFAFADVILIVGLLLAGIQQYRVIALRGEVAIETQTKAQALAANTENQATTTKLSARSDVTRPIQVDLDKRLKLANRKP